VASVLSWTRWASPRNASASSVLVPIVPAVVNGPGSSIVTSAAIVDEWWLFDHARERESFNALAQALHKRLGESWLLAITTAGFDKQSQLAQTYEKAINHPGLEHRANGFLRVLRDEQSGFLFWWYGLPEDSERDNRRPRDRPRLQPRLLARPTPAPARPAAPRHRRARLAPPPSQPMDTQPRRLAPRKPLVTIVLGS